MNNLKLVLKFRGIVEEDGKYFSEFYWNNEDEVFKCDITDYVHKHVKNLNHDKVKILVSSEPDTY